MSTPGNDAVVMSAHAEALAAASARLEKLRKRQKAAAAALAAASENTAAPEPESYEDVAALQAEIVAAEAEVKRWRVKLNPGLDAEGNFKLNLSLVADD